MAGLPTNPASLLRPPPSQGPASLLTRPPPPPGARAGPASLLTQPPPAPGAAPAGPAALLTRPAPPPGVGASAGPASLLTRPPPAPGAPAQAGPASLLTRPPPVPQGADATVEPAASARAEDWEDDYSLFIGQKDLGDGWDGYGEIEPEPVAEPAAEQPLAQKADEPASKEEPRRQPKHIFISSQPGTGKTTLVHKLLEKLLEEEGEGGVDISGFYTEEVRDPQNAKQRLGFDVVRLGSEEVAPKRAVLARLGQAAPKVGKYSVDVAAFEAFALPALEPPKEDFELPANPRLYQPEDGPEEAVSLLYDPTEDEEGANSRICLDYGEELNVPPSTLREVPEGWKPADEEEEPPPRLCVVDEVGKMGLLSVQFPKSLARVLEQDVVLATGVQTVKGQRDPEAVEDIKKRPGVRVVKLTRNNRDALVDQTYAQLRESLGLGLPTGKPKPKRVDKRKKKEEERKAKLAAEREEQEREERERAEGAEKEKIARRERQLAKEKARAERIAKERAEREVEAAKARAERKRRAEARKKAMEDAKNGVVPCVEHEDEDVEAVAPSLDLLDDAIDVVEEAPRKRARKAGSMASLPSFRSAASMTSLPSPSSPAGSPLGPEEPPASPPEAGGSPSDTAPPLAATGKAAVEGLLQTRLCLVSALSADVSGKASADLAKECRSDGVASSSLRAREPREGPTTLFEDQFPANLLDTGRADRSSWSGLREATSTALHRGKLDTYLWWHFAGDARKRLMAKSVLSAQDGEDATAVVVACARARVESPGLYQAWAKAAEKPQFSAGIVASGAFFLSRAEVLPATPRLWHDVLPRTLAADAAAPDLAKAAAAYAAYAATSAREEAAVTARGVFAELALSSAQLSATEAALALWAWSRLGAGAGGAELLWQLWPKLEGRLGEIPPVLVASLAASCASFARLGTAATAILETLAKRQKKHVELLCVAAGRLAAAGVLKPPDLWPVVEAARPVLQRLSLQSQVELLRAAALLGTLQHDKALAAALHLPRLAHSVAEGSQVEQLVPFKESLRLATSPWKRCCRSLNSSSQARLTSLPAAWSLWPSSVKRRGALSTSHHPRVSGVGPGVGEGVLGIGVAGPSGVPAGGHLSEGLAGLGDRGDLKVAANAASCPGVLDASCRAAGGGVGRGKPFS
ncbi:unnamed protein product [Effrenium voratum]|nr:unnamed protein product [Effrenium voratum]